MAKSPGVSCPSCPSSPSCCFSCWDWFPSLSLEVVFSSSTDLFTSSHPDLFAFSEHTLLLGSDVVIDLQIFSFTFGLFDRSKQVLVDSTQDLLEKIHFCRIFVGEIFWQVFLFFYKQTKNLIRINIIKTKANLIMKSIQIKKWDK